MKSCEANKSCRIGNAMGEGLMELEVMGMSGERMLTMNVADSMLGRELWKMILDKVPSKPGRQLVLSLNTARLVLNESLQQQGLEGERPTGVGYLCAHQFACCLAFSPTGTDRCRMKNFR